MTNNASLRVIRVELLDDMSNLEDTWMAQLNSIQATPMGEPVPEPIQKPILKNRDLFEELTELPPKRAHDHRICLKPNSQLVNLRTYRYLYHHTTELERQIKEMLDLGIIKHSQSPYASPTLMVGNKDGSL